MVSSRRKVPSVNTQSYGLNRSKERWVYGDLDRSSNLTRPLYHGSSWYRMHVGALVYFTQDMYVSSLRKWWVQVPRPFYSYFVFTSLLASNRPQTILFLDMENLSDFLTAVDIRSLVCLCLCVYTQAHEYVGACILGAHGYGGQQHVSSSITYPPYCCYYYYRVCVWMHTCGGRRQLSRVSSLLLLGKF